MASTASARPFYLEIFLVSSAIIILEISYTRVFSFKLYYYFTYLIIGLALLGLGAGGVFVAIIDRLRRMGASAVIVACCAAASAMILGGYLVIAYTRLNAFDLMTSPGEFLKLLLICLLLFLPFLLAGIVIATIFTARPDTINRLYCADLVGAGLGCACSVPLISVVTPPGCIMLSALVLATAAVHGAVGASRRVLATSVALATLSAAAVVFHDRLPDPRTDLFKTLGNFDLGASPLVFSRWGSVFRVDVRQNAMSLGASYNITHDGNMGSVLHRFDGDPKTLTRFDSDPRAFPFRVAKREPEVLIIGAAAGHEILASLYFGAAHITAVELNPVTLSLLTDHFREYSGRLASNPRVTLVNAEGRSFLNRSDTKFDLIWLVAPDSYAAMNAASAGAFVLSESYLYTVEMVAESLDHLTHDGIICAQFGELYYEAKPNRTARYTATAREAFRRRGVGDFASHVIVATTPVGMSLSTVLLKNSPFAPDDVRRFAAAAAAVPASVVRYGGAVAMKGLPLSRPDHPVTQVITLPERDLAGWYDRYGYDIRPVTDDSPFFWHFVRFRDALASASRLRGRGTLIDPEDLTGERVLVALLVFVTVFAGVFLLLPFAAVRDRWRAIPYKTCTAVYFGALGIGFMFFEVSLIQMLTLFLGYPTYSLSVTLFALLVSAGVGSRAISACTGDRNRLLLTLLVVLAIVMIAYRIGIPLVVRHLVGAPLAARAVVAIVLITPLGLCLGTFMPLGLATVAALTEYPREYVAWAWAVNGFLSVISSILSTILAMVLGFNTILLLAVAVYACGVMAFWRVPARG